ncbi:hypothetical protein SAMN05444007_105143 [Cribrihabitans marinus]|uniref:DUF4157 domain-containing protein n=1 Tax=Cribrihabitans marinus TaxID=1227549 RepID=A0A1H6ZVL3_9RHOB|nr:hypothetical protein [Cribrihabitans marinus]GGH30635.1 hypothetical protein GCM10010973_20930 [Cribrihabitans marinus]SEJ52835.1 hypothetical protein SAMN05444007_105143 [Cribrihabitans marinus]
MVTRFLLICIFLISCGRPLSETERAFAGQIHGDALDLDRVRLVEGAPVAAITFRRQPRPRVTCRERILPPVREEIVTSKPAAVALFNRIFFVREWYLKNYTPDYPDSLPLIEAMLLAHELTHVWQWQNRDRTGYTPLRAATEHGRVDDPYLFDLSGAPDLLSFGYEQQGAIVEEYVCCRALAPGAERTRRLHRMLSGAFPVSDLPQSRESDVYLPWRGAELRDICD